jgi:hypothetical protein
VPSFTYEVAADASPVPSSQVKRKSKMLLEIQVCQVLALVHSVVAMDPVELRAWHSG